MNAPSLRSSHLFLHFFKEQFLKISFAMALLGLVFIIPQTAFAAIYTVTNTSDSGSGSLRDAITQVNAGSGGDTINFSGVTGTITVGSTLTITQQVTINGPGANILAISGGDAVGVFSFGTGTTNSVISGLEITHGNATIPASHQGAGIYTTAAITINNCTFSYNTAGGAGGLNAGGALFGSAPLLTVNNSTFFNNTALAADGGAIYATQLAVNNSTFYNNTAGLEGGAIWVLLGTRLTINNSTIIGNSTTGTASGSTGGGGVWVTGNQVVITNSIVSGNSSASVDPDLHCALACTPPTGNLYGDATVPSLLTSLQYNGGPTVTMAPLPGKTGIIGAGLNSTLATDQRGVVRQTAGASDLGAVQNYNLVVSTTADSTDPSSLCDGSSGDTCSLRDALNLANTQGAGDIVTVTGLTGTITLNSPLPNDTANLNINGPGANQLTIAGVGSTGIFNITNPNSVTNISGVTLSGGSNTTAGGGAINNQGVTLTLNNCELNNNSATGQAGGALNNGINGTTTVLNCTFSGNSAASGGVISNSGVLNVENSTFNGNTASAGNGGAILNQGTAAVTSTTILGNTASGLGGGIDNTSTLALTNSIVAGNMEAGSPSDDCGSCGTQTTFNLTSTAGAPVSAAQVMLAPLALYGPNQTVRTMLPIPGSPVMQAGDPTQLPVDLSTDERQLPRTINGKLDLGAVESNYGSVQFVQQPTDTTVGAAISPSVSLSITESGVTVPNIPLTVSFTGNGNLHGTLTETTVAPVNPGDPAVATFTGLNVDTAGTGDVLNANVTVTPSGVAPPVTLTATSDPFSVAPVVSVPTFTVGPASPVAGQPATVTVVVPAVGSTPASGTITIYDNGNAIGTGTLGPDGTVVVTIPGGTLPVGTSTITVGYGGDGHYGSSTSAPQTVSVTPLVALDFTLTLTSAQSQTVISGGTAPYTVKVAPTNGAYPGAVSFTATGLPAGATATFTPATVAADGGPTAVNVSIQTASLLSANNMGRNVTPITLGLLLVPLAGIKRKRLLRGGGAAKRYLFMMLLLFAGIAATSGLTGCGKGNGFFGHAPKTYNITITATSAAIQHSVNTTLNVQ